MALAIFLCQLVQAQFLMDMLDTTKEAGRGMLGIYKKFDHFRLGGVHTTTVSGCGE